MSKIADIHTALLARLQTLLPAGYVRLPNPGLPESNPGTYLKLGYGIVMGPEQNANRYASGLGSYDFTWTTVLTMKVPSLENDGARKSDFQIDLLEDFHLIKIDLEKNDSLNNEVSNIVYVGHNGIEFVEGQDKFRFIMVRATFTSQYDEQL